MPTRSPATRSATGRGRGGGRAGGDGRSRRASGRTVTAYESLSAPVEDDLAALPGPGGLEGLLPLLGGEAMGDDLGDGRPEALGRRDHLRHGVPRVVHLAAVDALE